MRTENIRSKLNYKKSFHSIVFRDTFSPAICWALFRTVRAGSESLKNHDNRKNHLDTYLAGAW